MGASGSFHYDPNSNSDSSEKKFDSATSDAERFSDRPSGTRNVFISFHVEDESQVRFFTTIEIVLDLVTLQILNND